ncbi:MAG: 3'-5' exonuclease [Gemmatimonadaceae bacterium]
MGVSEGDAKAAADCLAQCPDYIVLRRLPRAGHYCDDASEPLRQALYVDVETTGLHSGTDAVIQFCGVPFEYAPESGRIHRVHPAIDCFEDPGRPIPDVVVRKTGITDAKVAGKRLDEDAILSALGDAVLVIAHNAMFDRGFLERRLPAFAEKYWACSQVDVPWDEHGYDSAKLEFLLFKHARVFYEAHRADEDCYAGIHLLATALPNRDIPMRLLLERARQPSWRVEATAAPMERKDLLKSRWYRWNPEKRVWWKDVPDGDRAAEEEWLRAEIYQSLPASPQMEKLDLKRRFT